MKREIRKIVYQIVIATILVALAIVLELYSYTRLTSIYIKTSEFSPRQSYLLDGNLKYGLVATYEGQTYVISPNHTQSDAIQKIKERHQYFFDPKKIAWQLIDNSDQLWYQLHPNWQASFLFIALITALQHLLSLLPKIHSPYLKENRLGDVLALIQVLSIDKRVYRSEEGISSATNGAPRSADTWTEIAQEHREIFRLNPNNDKSIALIFRHAQASGGDAPSCSSDQLEKLLSLAIDIHDRDRSQSLRWQAWIPVISSVTAALVAAIVALNKH